MPSKKECLSDNDNRVSGLSDAEWRHVVHFVVSSNRAFRPSFGSLEASGSSVAEPNLRAKPTFEADIAARLEPRALATLFDETD